MALVIEVVFSALALGHIIESKTDYPSSKAKPRERYTSNSRNITETIPANSSIRHKVCNQISNEYHSFS